MPAQEGRGRLVILTGLPASGKTTVANLLADMVEGLVVISSDELRKTKKARRPWTAMQEMTHNGLRQGLTVVVDATNYNSTHRTRYITVAREMGCPYVIVYFTARIETLLERNLRRDDTIPAGAIHRLSSLFEAPGGEDTLKIDTESTRPRDAAAEIARWVQGFR